MPAVPVALETCEEGAALPDGCRLLTEKEFYASRKVALVLAKAMKQGARLVCWNPEEINALDLPGFPPNSTERLHMFKIIVQMAEELVKVEPPKHPRTGEALRNLPSHLVEWE